MEALVEGLAGSFRGALTVRARMCRSIVAAHVLRYGRLLRSLLLCHLRGILWLGCYAEGPRRGGGCCGCWPKRWGIPGRRGRSLLGLPGDTRHTLACACRGVPLTMRGASGACGANGARRFQEANIVSFRNARLYMPDQIEGFV